MMLGLSLAPGDIAVRRAAGGGAAFNPLSLFANGEQGAWYDPSDLSTLFQDSAGTTPVTTAGDPVGLMLDKSQGLVLGDEEVPNPGGPFVNTTSWTPISSTLSVVDGNLRITGTGTFARASTPLTGLKVGATYKIVITLVSTQGSDTSYWLNTGFGSQSVQSVSGNNTTVEFYAVASSTTGTITLYTTRNSDGTGEFSDWSIASVKELAGNHASQSTATACPLYQTSGGVLRIDYDAVDDFLRTVFPNLGTDVTIARAVPSTGASILTGQTVGAGNFDDSTDHAGLIIVDRALTAGETAQVTAYLDAKAGA